MCALLQDLFVVYAVPDYVIAKLFLICVKTIILLPGKINRMEAASHIHISNSFYN